MGRGVRGWESFKSQKKNKKNGVKERKKIKFQKKN